jgi:hypothetical protein
MRRPKEDAKGRESGQDAPRDLIDFYRRWPDFRHSAIGLAERSDLSPLERQTVHWLVLLVDRISDHDLQPLMPRRKRSGKR